MMNQNNEALNAFRERCVLDVSFVVKVVEQLGWSSMCHVACGQALLRLDVALELDPNPPESLSKLQKPLQSCLSRLQREHLLSWPLFILRVKRILAQFEQVLSLHSCALIQDFEQLQINMLRSLFQGDVLAPFCAQPQDFTQLSVHKFVEGLWSVGSRSFMSHQAQHYSLGPVYAGRSQFLHQLCQSLVPMPGVISNKGFELSKGLCTFDHYHMLEVACSTLIAKALQQILYGFQTKLALVFFLVQRDTGIQILCFDTDSLSGAELAKMISRHIQALIPEINAPIHQPPLLIEAAPSTVLMVIDHQLDPTGVLLHTSSSHWASQLYAASNVETRYCIVSFVELQSLDHALSQFQKKRPLRCCVYLDITSVNRFPFNAVLERVQSFQALGIMIGFFVDRPQDSQYLMPWQGILNKVMIGAPWTFDLGNKHLLTTQNSLARLRYLKQGWSITATGVQCLSSVTVLAQKGVTAMAVTDPVKKALLSQEHRYLEH